MLDFVANKEAVVEAVAPPPPPPAAAPTENYTDLPLSQMRKVTPRITTRAPRVECRAGPPVGGSKQADSLQDHGPTLLRYRGRQHGEFDRCTSYSFGARSSTRDRCLVNAVARAAERHANRQQGGAGTSASAACKVSLMPPLSWCRSLSTTLS